jgi:hypothetical protein
MPDRRNRAGDDGHLVGQLLHRQDESPHAEGIRCAFRDDPGITDSLRFRSHQPGAFDAVLVRGEVDDAGP